jgi:hypothetical protein
MTYGSFEELHNPETQSSIINASVKIRHHHMNSRERAIAREGTMRTSPRTGSGQRAVSSLPMFPTRSVPTEHANAEKDRCLLLPSRCFRVRDKGLEPRGM